MEVICSTENGIGSRDLVESPSLGCSLSWLSSLMLRTGGGCSVCDEPESSFERFERVAGGVAGRFPRVFPFVDSEVLSLSRSPRRRFIRVCFGPVMGSRFSWQRRRRTSVVNLL